MVDLQAEIENLRRKCIGCGKCSRVCPSLKHGGMDPMEMMISGEGDISQCIGCGNCSEVCRRSDPFSVMLDLMALTRGLHPTKAFEEFGSTVPPLENPLDPGWDGDDVSIMPGCVVSGKIPYLRYASRVAVNAVGLKSKELEGWTCCMHPAMFREMGETVRRTYRIRMGETAKGSDLVTLCGGCKEELISSSVESDHLVNFLFKHKDRLPRLAHSYKVAVEPGCAAMKYAKEMKEVVSLLGCELIGNTAGCCGKNVPVSVPLMAERQEECRGADFIVVACPMCQFKYDNYEGGLPVMHIAELVAMAAGDTETLRFHRIPFSL